MLNWKEIDVPALEAIVSTGATQPLPRDSWPAWAQREGQFTGAWLSPILDPDASSTGSLSTEHLEAVVDIERQSPTGDPLRYYRYFYAKLADGRVFQAGPFEDLDYERHRDTRPPWLGSHTSESTG